ncbi:hypothetical protein Z046_03865 [Pseudomonas aeruginosa VRFPA09]|nr:hypothetical protein Z046_03865 [Pseudomonas aeruginosa VRFPA09]
MHRGQLGVDAQAGGKHRAGLFETRMLQPATQGRGELAEDVARMGSLGPGAVEEGRHLVGDEADRGAGDLRLALGEIVIERAFRRLGASDDVAQPGAEIPAAGQQRGGGMDDPFGGIGLLRQT